MRQVPYYLLIGNGNVARHFQHYLSLVQQAFQTWHRSEPLAKLEQALSRATHVLVLISDKALENFIINHCMNTRALLIHFSGSLATDKAHGAHPLMTFSKHLYNLDLYQLIPFVIDQDAPAFAELLPGFKNPSVRLEKSLKSKYHALCVLSGNFSCILWQKLFSSFETEFNIPKTITYPYLIQQMQNLMNDSDHALSGPLKRNDHETLEKNLQALTHDPFQEIYKSFVSCYQNSKRGISS